MSVPALDPPLAVAFRTFLNEVQETVTKLRRGYASGDVGRGLPLDPAQVHAHLSVRLRAAMDGAQLAGADIAAVSFKQTKYLMAIVADQRLRDADWHGARAWARKGLARDFPVPDGVDPEPVWQAEALLPASDEDGEEETKDVDAALLQVLLLTLACGYPDAPPERLRGDVRARLFRYLKTRLPQLDHDPENLFADAYRHRFEVGPTQVLPLTWGWMAACAAAFVLLAVASIVIWNSITGSLAPHVEEILDDLSPELLAGHAANMGDEDLCQMLAATETEWARLVADSGSLTIAEMRARLDGGLLERTRELASQVNELARIRVARRLGDPRERQQAERLLTLLDVVQAETDNATALASLLQITLDAFRESRARYCEGSD